MEIDEIGVPKSLDALDAGPFIEYLGVRDTVEIDTLGTDVITPDAVELLAQYASNPHRRRRHFAARRDGAIVGRALVTMRPQAMHSGAHVMVDVLPQHRGEGLGAALLDVAEQVLRDAGISTIKATLPHRVIDGGERVTPLTGFGDLSMDDPGVRFLLAHGYGLEQVNRISLLEASASVPAKAIDGYRVVTWIGPTPSEHRDDLAVLRTRMSTDAPMAGLAYGEDVWDVDRVMGEDQRRVDGGQVMLNAAAEHQESGRLVGFSELAVSGGARVATQEDTLVLREHRGHRLGHAMKAVTLRLLRSQAPGVEWIFTWNAEENRPVLDINEQMGFRAIGHEGGWLKRLDGADSQENPGS